VDAQISAGCDVRLKVRVDQSRNPPSTISLNVTEAAHLVAPAQPDALSERRIFQVMASYSCPSGTAPEAATRTIALTYG
jgi:hypothetical protein